MKVTPIILKSRGNARRGLRNEDDLTRRGVVKDEISGWPLPSWARGTCRLCCLLAVRSKDLPAIRKRGFGVREERNGT